MPCSRRCRWFTIARRAPCATLLVAPFPRSFLLLSKLIGGVAVAVLQAYTFLAVAYFWDITPPWQGYITVLPALILSGLMLGALALLMSSLIRQLENFAGVMNFVIFPMFFASSALYPLWRIREGKSVPLRTGALQSVHSCGRTHPLRTLWRDRRQDRSNHDARAGWDQSRWGAHPAGVRRAPRSDASCGGDRLHAVIPRGGCSMRTIRRKA